MYKLTIMSPSPLRIKMYKSYRNKLHHILKYAEKTNYENKFNQCKTDLRKSWLVIKEIIRKTFKNRMTNKSFIVNGSEVSDSNMIS